MTIQYTCKFCRQPGTTELEGQHTDMYRINKWHEILCCDRCGDFHSERIALKDRMTSIVGFIQQRKMADKFTPELESRVREKLVELTKKFSILVCNFHNKVRVWEPEFVDMILYKPEKLNQILWHYIRGISNA